MPDPSIDVAELFREHNAALLRSPPPSSARSRKRDVAQEAYVRLLQLAAQDRDALAWLRKTRPLRANFSSELEVNLKVAFDSMVFIDTATPARLLQAE